VCKLEVKSGVLLIKNLAQEIAGNIAITHMSQEYTMGGQSRGLSSFDNLSKIDPI
jgi:hypothetical protein